MRVDYLVDFRLDALPVETADYIVVGSGIAGLYTAIKAAEHGKVILLTKKGLGDTNTDHAQGGIAAVFDQEEDSPELHKADTLAAGAGLCDLEAVEVLVTEGPERVKELIAMGADFDRTEGGHISLTREGAHSRRRILHARGDATGEEIQRTLTRQVKREQKIDRRENHFVVDLLVWDERCRGVLAYDEEDQLRCFLGKFVVLATGGGGRLYRNTTNPEVATGDGFAIAYRAGAAVMDMEFVQFHPTALMVPGAAFFLISEAVRGEGAYLRNHKGERFMIHYHPLAELAPRDVVARAIVQELLKSGEDHVYLDLRHLTPDRVRQRFPKITATCRRFGLDLATDLIPVAPAAHYFMGGIKTDINGATTLPGLYACGETACVGVHGANRLASNSLLDGLVFGGRIVEATRGQLETVVLPRDLPELELRRSEQVLSRPLPEMVEELQEIMWQHVGLVRTAAGLKAALARIEAGKKDLSGPLQGRDACQTANMYWTAGLVAQAALIRTESRGGHYRSDYPFTDDAHWLKRVVLKYDGGQE
ncbi:L-aspartate oxidase [Carboxydocella sp. JDF658]|uniref:L-aspartate oxidase n=1 Tax=Carboxydocella sp. JDF658 TaxID=1926600 RepID=UPI0009ABB365|nr:L-aspartate oxidase [Carboxydocella sp. JDF658]GAW30384.1 L-aspartate oxidase [Carboxydocella sp. JDF658]